MLQLKIITTQNPSIVKFVFPDFIIKNDTKNSELTKQSYEFKNIDEAQNSPLAQQLFYLPFVKTVFISGNFIAIERYNIVDWIDVQDAVKEQIEEFINKDGIVIIPTENKTKLPTTVYGETTPNPAALKFVLNNRLTKTAVEFKSIDETQASPLAKELFKFEFVKEVFIDENYVSITKYENYDWTEITLDLRTFIKQFIENGGMAIDETMILPNSKHEKQQINDFDNLDTTSQQIINILEEYVKPAVAADGGNIVFDSYEESENKVKVILQGACNGCPSSKFTLKNGIENMLKDMLKNPTIIVEAV